MDSSRVKPLKLPGFDKPPKVLLVVAPFYNEITKSLELGAERVLTELGTKLEKIIVPGALEIPTAISLASENYDGFVALGCVIRGETTHYEIVANESSNALSILGLKGLCIGNGILCVENEAQALVRADPSNLDKGGDAAKAMLYLLKIKQKCSKPLQKT